MRFPLVVLWTLLVLSISTPSSPFATLGGRWPRGRVSYFINPNFPEARSGTQAQQIELLRCAADTWRTQSSAPFVFEYEGTTAAVGFQNDQRNTVSYLNVDGGDALAATQYAGFGSTFTAFDIAFYDESVNRQNRWNGPQDPPNGTIDISGVAVHEFGHALGLGHSNAQSATMFATASGRALSARTLHPDDRDGVEFLYGTDGGGAAGPGVLSAEPNNGPVAGGGEVILRGRNFTWKSETTLTIGGREVSKTDYEVESCGLIRVSSFPSGQPGDVTIRIENQLGTGTSEGVYSYGDPPPEVFEIDPMESALSGGVPFTIRGERFEEGAQVTIGGSVVADADVVNSGTITGTIPPGIVSGVFDVLVIQNGTRATLEDGFTYLGKFLRIGEGVGSPGQSNVPVSVIADSDEPLRGFSFAFSYSVGDVDVETVRAAGATEDAIFANANVSNATGVTTFGCVMSFDSEEPNIPAGNGQLVAEILVNVPADAVPESEIPLTIEERGGIPPINLIFNPTSGSESQPSPVNGRVTVLQGAVFRRGDADLSGELNITDAIFQLSNLFQGGANPGCLDAADANDDGGFDISDAVFNLSFLFLGGDPPPPPFPGLGVDPTDDKLDCLRTE